MQKEDVLQKIKEISPRIIYISGKTCTGKTTFANEVKEHGYTQIELDAIVTNSIVIPFKIKSPGEAFLTAYRDSGPKEHVDAFIIAAIKEIKEKLAFSPIVIEGAIAKSRILKEIFSGDLSSFFFVYFHPVHLDIYMGRMRERFVAGAADGTSALPKHFWDITNRKDVEEFTKSNMMNEGIENAIKEYAQISMKESEERLQHLQESFPSICVVEV
jgi:adenylate kinase family enzyme